jgi:hypothetical protein
MHTGCPRKNVPDFERVFFMVKVTDITQNTHVQSEEVGYIGLLFEAHFGVWILSKKRRILNKRQDDR